MRGAILASMLAAPAALAQTWTMEIHTPNGVERFEVGEIDSITFAATPAIAMVVVPAGSFTMGDGAAACGTDERDVVLTRAFLLGRREVTNQEYLDAVQWAYDHGRVTATPSTLGWTQRSRRCPSQASRLSGPPSLSRPVWGTGWGRGPRLPARGSGGSGATSGKQSRSSSSLARAWS